MATRVQTETDLIMEIDVGPDPIMPGELAAGVGDGIQPRTGHLVRSAGRGACPPELAAFGPDHANFVVSAAPA